MRASSACFSLEQLCDACLRIVDLLLIAPGCAATGLTSRPEGRLAIHRARGVFDLSCPAIHHAHDLMALQVVFCIVLRGAKLRNARTARYASRGVVDTPLQLGARKITTARSCQASGVY